MVRTDFLTNRPAFLHYVNRFCPCKEKKLYVYFKDSIGQVFFCLFVCFICNSYFRMVFGTHDVLLNIVHSDKTSLFRVYLTGENKKHSEPSSVITSRHPHWVIESGLKREVQFWSKLSWFSCAGSSAHFLPTLQFTYCNEPTGVHYYLGIWYNLAWAQQYFSAFYQSQLYFQLKDLESRTWFSCGSFNWALAMISPLFKLLIFQVYFELKFSFAFGCFVFADKELPTLQNMKIKVTYITKRL